MCPLSQEAPSLEANYRSTHKEGRCLDRSCRIGKVEVRGRLGFGDMGRNQLRLDVGNCLEP